MIYEGIAASGVIVGLVLGGIKYVNSRVKDVELNKVGKSLCDDRFGRVVKLESKMDQQIELLTRIDERVSALVKKNGISI